MLFSWFFLRVKPETEEIKENLRILAVTNGREWPLSTCQCAPLITYMEEVSYGDSMTSVMTVLTASGQETVCQRSHGTVTHCPFSFPGLLGKGLKSSVLSVLELLHVKFTKWSNIYCLAMGKAGEVKSMDFKDLTLGKCISPISL